MRFFSLFLPIFALATTFASAENWPSWRGPNHSGSTVSGKYPADLTDPANLSWKLALAGKGCSTPIVLENQIFITGPKGGQDTQDQDKRLNKWACHGVLVVLANELDWSQCQTLFMKC